VGIANITKVDDADDKDMAPLPPVFLQKKRRRLNQWKHHKVSDCGFLLLSTEIPEFGGGVRSVLGIRSQGLWLQRMCCTLTNCSSSISEVWSISPESQGEKDGWGASRSTGQGVQSNLGRAWRTGIILSVTKEFKGVT
jgi:hypothetical protein